MNKTTVKTAILHVLHEASGHPLPQDILRLQVRSGRVQPRPSEDEVNTCIGEMKRDSLIIDITNEMDSSNPLWSLDEKGQTLAARNRF